MSVWPQVLTIGPTDAIEEQFYLAEVGFVRQFVKECATHMGFHVKAAMATIRHFNAYPSIA